MLNLIRLIEGSIVTLDGIGSSSPDGDPITYSWTQICTKVKLSDATITNPTFVAPTSRRD